MGCKPKVFIIWSCIENVCWPLFWCIFFGNSSFTALLILSFLYDSFLSVCLNVDILQDLPQYLTCLWAYVTPLSRFLLPKQFSFLVDFSATGDSGYFFLILSVFDNFIYLPSFKNHLDLLLEDKMNISDCFLNFSISVSFSHFKLNVSQTELIPSFFQNSFLGQWTLLPC